MYKQKSIKMESEIKLFVSNVPYNCTYEEFKTFMMTNTNVKSVKLIVNDHTGVNKGFGFVSVVTQEAKNELIASDDVVMNGRKLKFTEYTNQHKFYKLHVSNVPDEVNEQQLYDVFSKFGTVDNVKKDMNFVTKKYRGTAVVVYNNYEDFNTVLTMKNVPFSETVVFAVTKRRLGNRQIFNHSQQFTQDKKKLNIQRKQIQ